MAGAQPAIHLAARLPPGRVSLAEADRLAVSQDLWPRHLMAMAAGRLPALPAAVVWPESVAELQAVARAAGELEISLVPYGAGSSVVGGASPSAEQVVVDLKRLARLVAIDAEGLTATAEAGIIGELFERQLARRGFTQGHFPSSIYCSSLGGWIAARSAGQMSSRYGKIEDQLLGGTLVLGTGELLIQPPAPVRDPTFDALVGAEGTLALWAEATVRIHRLPEHRVWRALRFPELGQALAAVRAWLEAGISPAVVRIYDPLDTWLHHQSHEVREAGERGPSRLARLGATWPRLTSWLGDLVARGVLCIVGLQGSRRQTEGELAATLELARRQAASDLGAGPAEAWYARRYAVSYGQSRAYRAGVGVDTMEVACAWDRVEPTYRAVRHAALEVGAQVLAHFSHAYREGASIYFTYALPLAAGVEAYDRLWQHTLAAAARAGANVSHHHGTGKLKAAALAAALGAGRRLWLDLQRELDPRRLLNSALLAPRSVPAPRASPPVALAAPPLWAAAPQATLAEVEAACAAEGLTLGPVAELAPSLPLLEAARRRWLWQLNPQLRLVESSLLGVDVRIGDGWHRFTPAPRAAMGPDLTARLLDAEVERLWLRPVPRAVERAAFTGSAAAVWRAVRQIASDEAAGSAALGMRLLAGAARLVVALPPTVNVELCREVIAEACRGLDRGAVEPWPALPTTPAQVILVAGSAPTLAQAGRVALGEGAELWLPWLDGAGGAGFVHAHGRLDADQAARLGAALAECRALPIAERRTEVAPTGIEASGVPVRGRRGRTPAVALRLTGHRAAVDNCAFCPKLCRFACPVGTADGNEALSPRQLMLTAWLDREAVQRLSVDAAARLWACVDCLSCWSFCDHRNRVPEALISARAELYARGGGPPEVRRYLAILARSGRPADRPLGDDLAAVVRGDGPGAPTWLFLGCQGSASEPEPGRAVLALARRHFGAVHVLAGATGCCGMPLWRWGAHGSFAGHARAFASQLGGVARLVVDDACCVFALRELYGRFGVALPEIVSAADLLRREDWRPRAPRRWAVHDNAFALRWLGEPSLATLPAFAGLSLPPGSVMENAGGACGSMMLAAYDPALAARVARHAVADLLGGGATRILTASPSCRRRLRSTGAPVDDLFTLWHIAAG